MRNYKYILIVGAVGSGIFRNLWPPLSSLNYLLRNQMTLRGHQLATYLPPGSNWEAFGDSFDSHGGITSIWIYQPIKVANNQGELISPENQAPGWNREWKLSLSLKSLCLVSWFRMACVCVRARMCVVLNIQAQWTFSEHLHSARHVLTTGNVVVKTVTM